MRLFNKAGESVLVDPGSEAEKLWRAKGFAPADEVVDDDDGDGGDDDGKGGNDGANGGSGETDAAAASAAARIAAKKRGK